MQRKDVFKSKYLKTEDLNGKATRRRIESVVVEEVGMDDDKQERAIVYFERTEKGMILNATNWDTLEEAFGPESDAWAGHIIELYPTHTKYKGQRVPAMRMRIVEEAGPENPTRPPPRQAEEPPPHGDENYPGDDVPF